MHEHCHDEITGMAYECPDPRCDFGRSCYECGSREVSVDYYNLVLACDDHLPADANQEA